MSFSNDDAEELRIRYKYRRLIVQGEISLPYTDAARLIGPDSAYRLYGAQKTTDSIGRKISRKKNNNTHSRS